MPTPPNNLPKSVTIGTGADVIVLKMAEDWYLTDAQYNILLDGTQIGTTQTVSALKANNQFDTVTVRCGLLDGSHTLTINFLNDNWDGTWGPDGNTPNGHDVNIYVDSATYNGVAIPNTNFIIYNTDSTNTITFNPVDLLPSRPPKSVTLGTGSDSLVFQITQSWYLADAQYNVYIDGVQVGANQTVSSIRSSGNRDTVTVKGNWSTGNHTCAVNFLNDALDHQTYVVANWHDRIIYITTARINGVVVPNSTMNIGAPTSPHTFTFTKTATAGNYPAVLTNAGITGATLTFSDEFSTLEVAQDDSKKWRSDGDANAYSVSNGILTLTLGGNLRSHGADYSTGFIQKYGYFEGRMQLPSGSGAWPGFYLSGQTGSDYLLEIDQMEGGSDPFSYYASFNVWKAPDYGNVSWDQAPWNVDPQGTTWDTQQVTSSSNLTQGFHVYGVLWKPGSSGGHDITFYLDDQVVAHQTVAASLGDSGAGDEVVIQNFLQTGTSDTPLLVDWVRVWQLP
jgi:hypothetical protein